MALPDVRPSAEDRIRAALWFAKQGFGIFSVWSTDADGTCRCSQAAACESPGKHPIGRQGFHDCTRDPERIRTLLSAASEPNYGLVCPDGVFVLDVDGDGVSRLVELEGTYGPLPPTLRTNTAHGQHVFLRWPDTLPRPIGQMFGYVTRWGSGSGAGYVIGPRSVHASGAVYAPAGPVVEIAELPEAWAAALIAPKKSTGALIEIEGGYVLPEPGYDGSRYDAIRDYVASRYMRGLTPEEVYAGVVSVLAPTFAKPLPEPELRSRFDRAWRGTPERLGEPGGAIEERVPAGVTTADAPRFVESWPAPPDAAAYHGPVGEIVELIGQVTEADPVGILGSVLASVGACMGHHRFIYQGSPQTTNIFVVLVGDSSSGRKGTAGSIARDIMSAAYPEWQDIVVAGLGSGEGLVSHLRGPASGQVEHRALVMESEFARLLTTMTREGSTLSPMVRDAWDGVTMGRVLARESAMVKWHHVGILAHVTPVELRARLTNTDAANGFGNRFIWLAVRRTRLMPFPESPRYLIPPHLLTRIRKAIEDAQSPSELHWSDAAKDDWESFYMAVAGRQVTGLFGAIVGRAESQVVRLALIYALLDGAWEVRPEHLRAAIALWDYAERSVIHVFGRSTGNRDADELLCYLADGPVSWESAKKLTGARHASDVSDAVATLERLGLADVVKVARSGGGRPTRWIRFPGQTVQSEETLPAPAQGEDA